MKYAVITFGCRVNQADSLHLEEQLAVRGARSAPPEAADLVIVNTCSVTASADQGARQTIRRVARMNPRVKIVATGCYATRCADDVAALPNVLHVVRNDDKDRLLDNLLLGGDGPCGAPLEPGVAGRTAWTLRVQTGCDERCSYCIIPTTRGRGRSTPLDRILDEVERVIQAGFKEIAVTGVHLGSYGRDLTPASSLHELLAALADVDDDVLFRVSSLEPMDCTPAIVELVVDSPRLAPHFHLPLQHASDRILEAMQRPYTAAFYATLAESIRVKLPHAAIGSDVIVGFPGETDEDFAELERYLESSPLTHVHVFPYSDRPGTRASMLDGKVPGPVVRQRGQRIREVGVALAARFRASQSGSVRRGLTLEDGTLVVTDNYLKARIASGLPRNVWTELAIPPDEAKASCHPLAPIA
ncbi:MAG TPA: MiaB/RimO family radical SAM methylthiotransferase [Vicinamibacterales bacterium]|jgi:threonylcarbamoyladenosine tRNA methylthiotransferase MtaB|nr:MiaB/RimO family radical SAM methylthiotransferase [Vicinamibacterales bacterium]